MFELRSALRWTLPSPERMAAIAAGAAGFDVTAGGANAMYGMPARPQWLLPVSNPLWLGPRLPPLSEQAVSAGCGDGLTLEASWLGPVVSFLLYDIAVQEPGKSPPWGAQPIGARGWPTPMYNAAQSWQYEDEQQHWQWKRN